MDAGAGSGGAVAGVAVGVIAFYTVGITVRSTGCYVVGPVYLTLAAPVEWAVQGGDYPGLGGRFEWLAKESLCSAAYGNPRKFPVIESIGNPEGTVIRWQAREVEGCVLEGGALEGPVEVPPTGEYDPGAPGHYTLTCHAGEGKTRKEITAEVEIF